MGSVQSVITIFTTNSFLTVDAPKITRHPESQSVVTGTPIAFTVEATGDELQFLWQKDDKDIDMLNVKGASIVSLAALEL